MFDTPEWILENRMSLYRYDGFEYQSKYSNLNANLALKKTNFLILAYVYENPDLKTTNLDPW